MREIIDIPEEVYNVMKYNIELNSDQKSRMESCVYHAILNGIHISENQAENCLKGITDTKSVLKEIRNELTKDYVTDKVKNFTYATVKLKDVLELIDKSMRERT